MFFSGFLTIRDPKVVLLTGVIDSPPSVSLTNPLVPTLFSGRGGWPWGGFDHDSFLSQEETKEMDQFFGEGCLLGDRVPW